MTRQHHWQLLKCSVNAIYTASRHARIARNRLQIHTHTHSSELFRFKYSQRIAIAMIYQMEKSFLIHRKRIFLPTFHVISVDEVFMTILKSGIHAMILHTGTIFNTRTLHRSGDQDQKVKAYRNACDVFSSLQWHFPSSLVYIGSALAKESYVTELQNV